MQKIDYRKEFKALYKPSAKQAVMVDVPIMDYLMIDGQGDPNTSQAYQEAVEALFGLAYALKFMIKKGDDPVDYAVAPLEGLWWADDMTQFSVDCKSDWKWTAMIMQPAMVTREKVALASAQVAQKKNPPALSRIRFEPFHEGLCAQILHIGPFSQEGPTIAKLHAFIQASDYLRAGKHHEVYLSDFRKATPDKLQTIVRQPVVRRTE